MNKQVRISKFFFQNGFSCPFFEGERKYISTGAFSDSSLVEEVTYENKPSRANLCGHIGDIIFAKMKNTSKVELLDDEAVNNIYSTGFYCVRAKNISPDFLCYVLQSYEFNLEKDSWSFGTTQFSINDDHLKKINVQMTTDINEQALIVKKLDLICERVDKLINNEQKQIEKLKEYKQSLICEVVTKGLDPNVPMKDSGVEWIGKIPEGWKIKKFKYWFHERSEKYLSGSFDYIALENIESWTGKYVETETNRNYQLLGSIKANKHDVIFGKLRPYLAKSLLIDHDCFVSSEFAVFYSLGEAKIEFLNFLFLSKNLIEIINSSTYGTKMPRVNVDFIKNLYLALPPFNEEEKICAFLKSKLERINEMISIKERKKQILEKYKKSLIYEYVTRKKEVD